MSLSAAAHVTFFTVHYRALLTLDQLRSYEASDKHFVR